MSGSETQPKSLILSPLCFFVNKRVEEDPPLRGMPRNMSNHTLIISITEEIRLSFRLIILAKVQDLKLFAWKEAACARKCTQPSAPRIGERVQEKVSELPLLLSLRDEQIHLSGVSSGLSLLMTHPGTLRVLHDMVYHSSTVARFRYQIPDLRPHYPRPLQIQHYISIRPMLPCGTPTLQTLPSSILRTITAHSLDQRWPGKLSPKSIQSIVVLALVSKAWVSVLDILWENTLGSPYEELPIPNLQALADLLALRPQLANRLRFLPLFASGAYSSPAYDSEDYDNCEAWRKLIDALEILIRVCPNLRSLEICLGQLPRLSNSLSILRHVEEFCVRNLDPTSETRNGAKRTSLLEAIQKWSSLRKIFFTKWPEETMVHSEGLGVAPYSLETLRLFSGILSGKSLAYIVSNPSCRLSRIKFYDLSGPTNEDLHFFLSITAATLEEVDIFGCKFGPPAVGEECAFDQSVQQMSRLCRANIQGDLSTTRTILRKGHTYGQKPLFISIHFTTIDDAFFFLGLNVSNIQALNSDGTNLLQAMLTTGWKEINFDIDPWEFRVSSEQLFFLKGIFQKAMNVAMEREIKFQPLF